MTQEMGWFEVLIEKYHPTRESLISFVESRDCKYALDFLLATEKIDGTPIQIWKRNWPNCQWHKICYAIALVVETNSTGTIKFYHPGGQEMINMCYVKGEYKGALK